MMIGADDDDDKISSSSSSSSDIAEADHKGCLKCLQSACRGFENSDDDDENKKRSKMKRIDEMKDALCHLHGLLFSSSSSSSLVSDRSHHYHHEKNENNKLLMFLSSLRSSSSSSSSIEKEEWYRCLRLVLWMNLTLSSDETESEQASRRLKGWEIVSLLLEGCGGEWTMTSGSVEQEEEENDNRSNNRAGGTLCSLVQLCAGEIRLQLERGVHDDDDDDDDEVDNDNSNTTVSIVSVCSRIMLSVLAVLLVLAQVLEDEDDSPETTATTTVPLPTTTEKNMWIVELPFVAVLHIKNSLDEAHDAMFQFLDRTTVVATTSTDDIQTSTHHHHHHQHEVASMQLVCARGIGAWLVETDLVEIPSPSPDTIRRALRNAVLVCDDHDGNVATTTTTTDTDTRFSLVDLLPALIKMVSSGHDTTGDVDVVVELPLQQQDYVLFCRAVETFMTRILATTNNKNNNEYDDISLLRLPSLGWAFLFYQQVQDRFPTNNDDNVNFVPVRQATMVNCLRVLHASVVRPVILKTLLRQQQQQQQQHDETDNEDDLPLQLFQALCDGVQCYLSLFSLSIHNDNNVDTNNTSVLKDTLHTIFVLVGKGHNHDQNVTSVSTKDGTFYDIINQTADAVFAYRPPVSSTTTTSHQPTTTPRIMEEDSELMELIRKWSTSKDSTTSKI